MNDKGLPLGLVTSPILSNIYMKEFDNIIYGKLKKMGLDNIIYTRYADDIVISFKAEKIDPDINVNIKECVIRCLKQVHLKSKGCTFQCKRFCDHSSRKCDYFFGRAGSESTGFFEAFCGSSGSDADHILRDSDSCIISIFLVD